MTVREDKYEAIVLGEKRIWTNKVTIRMKSF
jgi:hypothetical protein